MGNFFEEFWDEISDFFEDLSDHLFKRKPKEPKKTKTVVIGGIATTVRPAYLFAERIDNLIRIFFGLSIIISALTATFLGFASLGDLVEVLIFNFWGRILAFLIGLSYLTIGLWKILHLGKANQ